MAGIDEGDERPGKRIRQACEPCRRKKTRCPGEKPRCSFCERLHQTCTYADDQTTNNGSEQWVEEISKLNQKIDTLVTRLTPSGTRDDQYIQRTSLHDAHQQLPSPGSLGSRSENYPNYSISTLTKPDRQPTNLFSNAPPSFSTILAVVKVYARRCHCQPLPLFRIAHLCENTECYNWEVLYAIMAVAIRFADELSLLDQNLDHYRTYADNASQLVMGKIAEGREELSILQALCLLSLVDFTDGRLHRAWSNVGLGIHLYHLAHSQANASGDMTPEVAEDWRCCFWSLNLIDMMCSNGRRLPLSLSQKPSQYPRSNPKPFNHLLTTGPVTNLGGGSLVDLGMVAYTLQLTEVWQETIQYCENRLDPTTESPWSLNSGFSKVVAHLMEFETGLPESHRFLTGRFSEQESQSLRDHSGYWGPWLYAQFIFHTISCLLYHPFFISNEMKIRSTRFPFTFIDNCASLLLLHTNWIDIFVSMIAVKDFPISDPFVAYCVSVAASINLWYFYAEGEEIREKARSQFRRCYRFITKMSSQWPIVQNMVVNLDKLGRIVSEWQVKAPFTPYELPDEEKALIRSILIFASYDKNASSINLAFSRSTNAQLLPAADVSTTHLTSADALGQETDAISSSIIYTSGPRNILQDSAGSSDILRSQAESSMFLDDNPGIRAGVDFDTQLANSYRLGVYGWPGMGNL